MTTVGVIYNCDRCEQLSKTYMFSFMAVGFDEPMQLCETCREAFIEWFMEPTGATHLWFEEVDTRPKPVLVEL